jgi:hypothetical protein
MQTIFPPRSPGNNWAYWKVDNLHDLPEATKRHRLTISFILTANGYVRLVKTLGTPTCVHCKQAITTEHVADTSSGVYGDYNPRTKRAKLWHYQCGWGALLSDIIIDERANRILVPENIQL